MKNIAVYCGASSGNQKIYQLNTQKLGYWLVENNYGLVYGGGNKGLMNLLANSVIEKNGFVHGIITQKLYDRNLAHNKLSELEIVNNMSQQCLMTPSQTLLYPVVLEPWRKFLKPFLGLSSGKAIIPVSSII